MLVVILFAHAVKASTEARFEDEALHWAQRAMEKDQGVYAQDALAWALYKNGRWAEAAEAARRALALGTRDAYL